MSIGTSPQIFLGAAEGRYPPEISRKLLGLRQAFRPHLLEWAIGRGLEMRERGDPWTAHHLRSEGAEKFPDLPNEVSHLADVYFADLDAVVSNLHERRKRERSPSSPQPGEAQPAPADAARASQSEGFKGGPQRQHEKGGPPP
jgi:hypothetical protein